MEDIEEYTEELADEGIGSGVAEEPEFSPDNEDKPFDPKKIDLVTKTFGIEFILKKIRNKTLNLAPDFQRNFVWDKKRKSQLIESMLLRIPLPMFYVAEDKNGNWEVVDGLQRLSTMRDFFLGEDYDGKGFKLEKLEFYKFMNTYNFFKIEKDENATRLWNNLMETQLSFTLIRPDTPENVKRNIFKRINTGGIRLSEQEIRHALYNGFSTSLLKEMSSMGEFKLATNSSVNDNRMAARELALRFLAFQINQREDFIGAMDDLLSDTMIEINDGKVQNIDQLKEHFKTGLIRSNGIFGNDAFRTPVVKAKRKPPINKALFEVWISILCRLSEFEYRQLVNKKNELLAGYIELFKNEAFVRAISRHAASPAGARERYNVLFELVKGFII